MSSVSLTPLTIQRNVYLSSSLFLMVEPAGSLKDADCMKTLGSFTLWLERWRDQTNDPQEVKVEKMCLLCHMGFDLNPWFLDTAKEEICGIRLYMANVRHFRARKKVIKAIKYIPIRLGRQKSIHRAPPIFCLTVPLLKLITSKYHKATWKICP